MNEQRRVQMSSMSVRQYLALKKRRLQDYEMRELGGGVTLAVSLGDYTDVLAREEFLRMIPEGAEAVVRLDVDLEDVKVMKKVGGGKQLYHSYEFKGTALIPRRRKR